MSRGQLTAVIAALALGAFAPRLAAQDTSAAGRAQPDTSGYSGAAGVDTSAQPGMVDSAGASTVQRGADSVAPGRADRDSSGALGASDTSGMRGRHPDTTRVGDSTAARAEMMPADSGQAAPTSDSASIARPTKQPGQSTSRTGDSASTLGP